MEKPKVIFLDAVGTLFGVRGSVGQIYGAIAQKFGVEADSSRLDTAFTESFETAPPLAFPETDVIDIPDREYQWWQDISQATFEKVGLIEQFQDFEAFFEQLYGHFATPTPWFIYDDILPALNKWKADKIPLGIISNFDSRLHAVLEGLDLENYFQSVTISSSVGAAKPSPKIFAAALKKHHCEPHQAWHIGDSRTDDFNGAKNAGLKAFLLERQSPIED
jgi:putative hydrolase of the HAD superfamily